MFAEVLLAVLILVVGWLVGRYFPITKQLVHIFVNVPVPFPNLLFDLKFVSTAMIEFHQVHTST